MAKKSADKQFAERLGEVIRVRRDELGMSQVELARVSKFHRNWIGRVERGQVNLTVWCLAAIATALDTAPWKLLKAMED